MQRLGTIIFLVLLSLRINALSCGDGVPILTRKLVNGTIYSLEQKCLCPADFYGSQCTYHTQLLCYLQAKSIDRDNSTDWTHNSSQTNSSDQTNDTIALALSLSTECFVHIQQSKMPLVSYLFSHNQANNYDIANQFGEGVEIIWANDSSLFDEQGILVSNNSQQLTPQEQQAIIDGPGQYKFTYKSKFFGFPLSDSIIHYQPVGVRYLRNSVPLDLINLTLQDSIASLQINQSHASPLEDLSQRIKHLLDGNRANHYNINFSILISPIQLAEQENIRIQLIILELYRSNNYMHHISMNAATWRLPTEGLGQPVYVDRFNRTYSIWIKITIVIAIAIALLLCLKLGVVVFQKLRKVKLASKDKHKQLIDEINASSFENY